MCPSVQFGTNIALYVECSKMRLYISSRGHFKQLCSDVCILLWLLVLLLLFDDVAVIVVVFISSLQDVCVFQLANLQPTLSALALSCFFFYFAVVV